MLALLVLHRGHPVTLESIVDRLWPDEAPDSAVKTIQVYVSRIRAALGPDRDRIVSRNGAYELVADVDSVDAAAFAAEVAAAQGFATSGTADDALAAVDRALDRWGGRPFGDLADEPFLRAETQRLEDLEAGVQELRADLLVALGRAPDAIGTLRRLVAEQPARETAWSRLVLALYAAGRQADALDAFHRARAYLDEELGIEPGPQLQAAHLAVLQQSAAIPVRPAVPALGGSAGPMSAGLVTALDGIVGRDAELAAIEATIAAGVRLVTLTGPGGIGKTTLWRALLRRHDARDADGPAVPVELEAVRSADLVPAAVAAAIGGSGDAIDQLGDAKALVGLDNLEQLVDAAPWIASFLGACPRIQILATSREPLRIDEERVHVVGPLGPDASRDLFLARARRVRPDLEPSAAIDSVCDRLDRLPLAIELAAARTSLLSPAALLARLDHALDVLGATTRDRSDRQRTLRSTIAWSYDLLEPELQRVFRRLSVFVGGFGLEAAETVSGASLDDLDKLLTQSLLVARYDREEPRFGMLETIRAFGLERLAAGGEVAELTDTRSAHLAWAVSIVASAGRPGDRDAAIRGLVDELDNLRGAMAWATEVRDDVRRWQIAVGLSDVWQTRGHLTEAGHWLEDGLDEADLSDDLRLEALDDASTMAFRQGRLDDATRLADQQLALSRARKQPRRTVAALAKLAQIALRAGDAERARALHADALAIAARDSDRRPLLVSLSSLANADLLDGRADLAITAFVACLEIARQVGRPESVATACFNVGLARVIDGRDLDGARSALREAIDRYEALDDDEGIGYVLVTAASLLSSSDPRAAARSLGAASAALASVAASLEVVEGRLRDRVEADLRDRLGEAPYAAELAAGAAMPRPAWIGIARAAFGG
jgi:predicted ATPase/DNA-binding SARP family transcriptional activator